MHSRTDNSILDADRVLETVDRLQQRIDERFPGSGLGKVCHTLRGVAARSKQYTLWLQRPIIMVRVATVVMTILIIGLAAGLFTFADFKMQKYAMHEFAQMIESGINDIVFVAVAFFFAATLEGRIKRRRVLKAIHELRSLAHVVDMHQLTKDPYRIAKGGDATASSPHHDLTAFELTRYLDYCAEMCSLIGKICVLYVQNHNDPVVLEAVNDMESLTNELSHKIWQKMMILYLAPDANAALLAAGPPGTPDA